MVEIRYGDCYEVADLAGQSIAEARQQFKAEFGIAGKARAKLNNQKVSEKFEAETRLADSDRLSFAESKSGKGIFLVGALLLALAITGGVFAYGLTTMGSSLTVTSAGGDFASVAANTSDPISWNTFGKHKGAITASNGGTLWDIDTTGTANYTGDLVITVSLANGDELVNVYRVLALFLNVYDVDGNLCDIELDGDNNTDEDYALLTLGNGAVDIYIEQDRSTQYTVKLKSGFYVSQAYKDSKWLAGYEDPDLFVEVAQR